jgi:hypothetical protein
LIARLSRNTIIVQEVITYWDLRSVLEQINPILLSKGYKPKYFFEGTPVIGQGGFSMIIKLDRELGSLEIKILTRLLSRMGLKVIRED